MSKGSKAKYATPEVQRDAFGTQIAQDESTLDSFEPDYEDECQNCDTSPTVTGMRHGRIIVRWNLCGPCCFGEARMLDPREWNE